MNRTLRTLTAGLATALVLVLGGCSMFVNSRAVEYRDETERLYTAIAEQVPKDLTRIGPYVESRWAFLDTLPGREEARYGYWRIVDERSFIDDVGTSERVAAIIDAYLRSEGFTYERIATRNEGTSFSDGYRRAEDDSEGWFVRVIWNTTVPDRAEGMQIYVESPLTPRGDDPLEPGL
ncbi:hypothetical protein [Microbacterium sp. Yaish 1]|uniref:hypothetical protein n=1 Tax=Microbacterium sp. Yaish 1 TaxID=2025014 RepID=UPI000B93C165|nr:hypothetical protein [Microbacterium sp. Yaish 1]OYC98306.1 hypothetical protein CI089_07475 [Microbacterium sp. Yaish 1]